PASSGPILAAGARVPRRSRRKGVSCRGRAYRSALGVVLPAQSRIRPRARLVPTVGPRRQPGLVLEGARPRGVPQLVAAASGRVRLAALDPARPRRRAARGAGGALPRPRALPFLPRSPLGGLPPPPSDRADHRTRPREGGGVRPHADRRDGVPARPLPAARPLHPVLESRRERLRRAWAEPHDLARGLRPRALLVEGRIRGRGAVARRG